MAAFRPSQTSTVPTYDKFPSMGPVNRRALSEQTLASLVTLLLLETLFQRNKPISARHRSRYQQPCLSNPPRLPPIPFI